MNNVFVTQDEGSKNVKIGIVKDAKGKYERLSDAKDIESCFRDWFKDHHIEGEWFKPCNYLMYFIEAFKRNDIDSFCKEHQDLNEEWEKCNSLMNFAIKDYHDGNYSRIRFLRNELIDVIRNINNLLPENIKK